MIFVKAVTPDSPLEEVLPALDSYMHNWTDKAARGECGWICSDCGDSYPKGMPDGCGHGDARCTAIILRDKLNAHR